MRNHFDIRYFRRRKYEKSLNNFLKIKYYEICVLFQIAVNRG